MLVVLAMAEAFWFAKYTRRLSLTPATASALHLLTPSVAVTASPPPTMRRFNLTTLTTLTADLAFAVACFGWTAVAGSGASAISWLGPFGDATAAMPNAPLIGSGVWH